MEKDFINNLNEAQKNAVEYCEGPQLIIAGAGSGKTRVLTYKIAYLISKGIQPNKIMALTFTNKASNEMKERIDYLLGYQASKYIWMDTFHSIFGRILRIEADKLGFTSNYTIYDSADSLNLVKFIIKEMNLNDELYKPKSVVARISAAKNDLWTAQGYAQNNDFLIQDYKEKREHFHAIYSKYSQRCSSSNVMDFDDLLLFTNVLFKVNADVLDKYRQRFDYILVDEYQDTNFSQYLIVKKLSEIHRKICVVGDDAQSIYSFRGARIQNILNFKNDYPDYKLFKLEQNYRSTKNIVNAANSLIKNNKNQIQKNVFSENNEGQKIKVEKTMTDGLEGIAVAQNISRLVVEKHFKHSDFAILYRTNAQSRIMEDALRKFNIPYKVYGGLSFYQRKEIKDVIAYIRLCINHDDTEAFRRIVNYPSRKIGATTVDKVLNFVDQTGTKLWELLEKPDNFNVEINAPTKARLKGFANLINSFQPLIDSYNATEFLVELVNKSGINNELVNDKTPEGISRYENLQELLNAVQNFCDQKKALSEADNIIEYLQNIMLFTDLENSEQEKNYEKVNLMTIHSAKGLEFKNVLIVGVEENLFPSIMASESDIEIEEERRLFYVAITRAMENLFIYYAANRFRFGSTTSMRPSRFIKEINSDFIDWKDDNNSLSQEFNFFNNFNKNRRLYQNKERKIEDKPIPPKKGNFVSIEKMIKNNSHISNNNIDIYKVGMTVAHNSFGKGIIQQIIGEGENSKAIILFDNNETKTLLIKFAKLIII